jgi:hypothetical protein
MGLTHVTVALRGFTPPAATYEADFLVDPGATDSLAPAGELRKIGVQPVGTTVYELAESSRTVRSRNTRSGWFRSHSWVR